MDIRSANIIEMAVLRINEAIERAKQNGKIILKIDLAGKLWPESTRTTQKVNISRLSSGKTKNVEPEQVEILCRELGCSADFLFGIEE